ncbi:solute carrier family 19 (folate transporter), member 1 [Pelomyxa schiedti]|nr:solute carrier family 19 (folate transporter), member 1 [Pelomyxa schiedti]
MDTTATTNSSLNINADAEAQGETAAHNTEPQACEEGKGRRASGVCSKFMGQWRGLTRQVVFTLGTLCVYQLMHSFKPSDSYMVQIVAEKNVTNQVYYDDITPVATYAKLPATIVMGLLFELAGYRIALLVESLMLVCGLTLTILAQGGYAVPMLKASEVFFGFNFSAGFLVNCAMFVCVSDAFYQLACSVNSITMMAGNVLSSYTSQCLVRFLPNYSDLLYFSLGSAICCFLCLLFGVLLGSLKKPPTGVKLRAWAKYLVHSFHTHYSSLTVVTWSVFMAATLGVHTLVNSSWKSLLTDLAGDGPTPNFGAISGTAYLVAMIVLLISVFIGKEAHKSWLESILVLCGSPIACSILFCLMGFGQRVKSVASVYLVYNALAEYVLMIASSMIAHSMDTRDKELNDKDKNEDDQKVLQEQAALLGSPAKADRFASYALMFAVNYCISLLIQDTFMATVDATNAYIRVWFYCYIGMSFALGVFGTTTYIIAAIPRNIHSCNVRKNEKN